MIFLNIGKQPVSKRTIIIQKKEIRYARHACRVRKAQHNSAVKAFGNNKKPVSGSFFLLTGFFYSLFCTG